MDRRKLKEILRPTVKEALSDYLKDSEQDTRALQTAHPQIDMSEATEIPQNMRLTHDLSRELNVMGRKVRISSGSKIKKTPKGNLIVVASVGEPYYPSNARSNDEPQWNPQYYITVLAKKDGKLIKILSKSKTQPSTLPSNVEEAVDLTKPYIEWFGNTAVVSNFPKNIDAYMLLRFCDNVEHEGGKQYRFDNVDRGLKKKFIDVVNGKVKIKESSQLNEAYNITSLANELKQKFGGKYKIRGVNIFLTGVSNKKDEIYKFASAKFKEFGARQTNKKESPVGLMINPIPFNGVILYVVNDKSVKEASTTSAVAGYQTPYAFSDTGISKDVKKRKIAQQLGYELVKKNRLKEEVRVNITKAVPLLESFKPHLVTPIANQLYMKMLDYLLMSSDPKYNMIKKFRKAIERVPNSSDKQQLILSFNDEFRHGGNQSAWDYYK